MKTNIAEKSISHIIENNVIKLPQLVFEVTNSCNLSCEYCAYGSLYGNHDLRNNESLSIEKALLLLEYLYKFWSSDKNKSSFQQINISFYGGEPLINMDFIVQIINYLEKIQNERLQFFYSMTTNATLLNKHIDYLIQKDFKLLISLDGNKVNNNYRLSKTGKSSFEIVYSNLKTVAEKHPVFFKNNININSVLHNLNSVDEIYNYIKSEFGKIPRISELNKTGIREEMKEIFADLYKNKNKSLLQSENYDLIQKEIFADSPDTYNLTNYIFNHSGNVYMNYIELIYGKSKKRIIQTGTCFPFNRKMFVTTSGKILPCEKIGHQYALGQITEFEVLLDFRMIAKRYCEWLSKISNQCSYCKNSENCTQCIFNIDNLDIKPVCKGFMSKDKFNQYTSSLMNYLRLNPDLYKKIIQETIIR